MLPEQRLVSTVGDDVIDDVRLCCSPILLADGAERMRNEKRLPGFLPPAVITSLPGTRSVRIYSFVPFAFVLGAVTILGEASASKLVAWLWR